MRLKIYNKFNNPFRLNNPRKSDYDNLYDKYFLLQDEYVKLEKGTGREMDRNDFILARCERCSKDYRKCIEKLERALEVRNEN